jgi:hypothetical protein
MQRHLNRVAGCQVGGQLIWAELDANNSRDTQAEMTHHLADLPILAFSQLQPQPSIFPTHTSWRILVLG